jgi:hypothetical protein
MKKIASIILIFSFLSAAGGIKNKNNQFLNYVDKTVNYSFEIKGLKNLQTPFYVPKSYLPNSKRIEEVKKYVELSLMSIFLNKAYMKVDVYLNSQLINTYKKWVSLNQSVYNCKLIKLNFTSAVFKCGKRLLIKELNHKLKNLKVRDRK